MEPDEFDIITSTQANAPNLSPVMYIDGNNEICCTEAYQPPRQTLCETNLRCPPIPPVHCLRTFRPCSQTRFRPSRMHERDILFRPIRWRCKEPTKFTEKHNEPSLGAPIGVSKSSFSLHFLESKPTEQSLQGFATLLVAFAEYFITPEIEWDENVINRILLEGQSLYVDSKNSLSNSETLKEATIKKNFILCQNTFNVMVNDPFLIGHVIGKELPVPNLHWGLLKFFKKFQFCLLQLENWYALLWKNADVYFVFDCFGRRTQDFRSDRERGIAMLISLRSLDNVSHLIMNLSGIQPEQIFTIRHLQLKSLIPCGGKPLPEIVDRSIEFEIISPDYALLRGTIHLGSKCFKEIMNRHSLPVAICALINAKIDAAPTWDSTVMDNILHLGANFYKQWTQCDATLDLGIQDVPNVFEFGQFNVQIAVNTICECGQWKCTPNYHESDLSLALKKAFEQGSNLLVQIQSRSYAIWKKGAFYYVFDPYSHQCTLRKKKNVTTSLRMCGTIDRLCCIVTQALLELFEESKFLIHLVKILQVEKMDTIHSQIPCRSLVVPQTDCAQEVISLNESVLCCSYGYECTDEICEVESDSADLDSPGLSQTRLEDYNDMRRAFIEESSEESDEDEDRLDDLDAISGDNPSEDKSDRSDDQDGSSGQRIAKAKKKNKKNSEATKEGKSGRDTKSAAKGKGSTDDDIKDSKKSKKEKEKEIANAKKESERKAKEENQKRKKEQEMQAKEKKEMEKKEKEEQEKAKKEMLATEKEKNKLEKEKRAKKDPKQPKDLKQPIEPKEPKSKYEQDKQGGNDINPQPKTIMNVDANNQKNNTNAAARRSTEADPKQISNSPSTTFRRQRHQRRKEQDGDGTSSDENQRTSIPVGCKPNSYPGFTEDPQDLAVVGSESGSYESLCSLLQSAFRCADRVLTMTPWGNYVAFHSNKAFLIFDGCTCNLRSIRHMDVSVGTAGLLCFSDMHSLIKYIISGKEVPKPTISSKRDIINQICSEYCNRGNK